MGATFQADHTERSADQDRLSIETLLTPSSTHPMNGSFRRNLAVHQGVDEGWVATPFSDLHHCGVQDLRPTPWQARRV